MPELPEVEAARRGIAEQLVGRTCTGYELFRPRLIVAPPGLTLDAIVGHPLEAVGRWGKYLWLVFPPCALLVHLKLTGQLVARGSSIPGFAAGHPVPPYDAPLPHKSTALRIDFAPDAHLYLTDVRHFARVQLLPPTELPATLRALRLGPDALSPDFTLDTFRATLARRRGIRLKARNVDAWHIMAEDCPEDFLRHKHEHKVEWVSFRFVRISADCPHDDCPTGLACRTRGSG